MSAAAISTLDKVIKVKVPADTVMFRRGQDYVSIRVIEPLVGDGEPTIALSVLDMSPFGVDPKTQASFTLSDFAAKMRELVAGYHRDAAAISEDDEMRKQGDD